ncbi:hypothetical protein [Enterovirga rhinocerotis]|uniref:Uncharacterized protein n=1 Tax=Enterovirga rhinocerotis TaxID=1339210 RepID=A0A4R7C4W4_9HYPH|nr:hypothetical protein [Enterovirga rhinocerotis]TDR93438.1 hypothetical protein EV668_0699 [Enterovirga rhinocerotis]
MRRLLSSLPRAALAFSAGLLAGAPLVQAREVVPAEKRVIPYAAHLPTCGDPAVLARISAQFAEKESRFWSSSLTLVEYGHIKPLAWRPWGVDTIPRRYCTASVVASNGHRHRIDYAVAEDLGFIGVGWGVTWCVLGLDRNLAYSPSCRMARP